MRFKDFDCMKKLVLFDFDGTLADTSEGIINSHKYAHKMMGREIPSDEVLYSVIGGPLLQTYMNRFGFNENEAIEAVKYYREFYAKQGINEAKLYPGIKDLLITLKQNGIFAGVATLKAEKFAKIMSENLGVAEYFSVIHGIDANDKSSKSDIIKRCLADTGINCTDALMVGDSIHDYNGAVEAGVDFTGVTYGFGFANNSEKKSFVTSAKELKHYILKEF